MNPVLKIKKVPKKQLDNPKEIHPTKDGLLRVTPDNAAMASVMMLTQIRDAIIRIERKIDGRLINNG